MNDARIAVPEDMHLRIRPQGICADSASNWVDDGGQNGHQELVTSSDVALKMPQSSHGGISG